MQQQCNYIETKTKYYKSIEEFEIFMNHKQTFLDISIECRNACIMIQEVLKSKENKLGNHWQMKMSNCTDAMTTSPVEPCNNAIKYGSHSIHSNMNLDTNCGRVLTGANSRIQWRKNDVEREMLWNNFFAWTNQRFLD